MPSASSPDRLILLVAPDPTAWEVLQAAAAALDGFGLQWQRAEADVLDLPDMLAGRVTAVIVASPDEVLPGKWSAGTGLVTLRVPVPGNGRAGLSLLRRREGENLPAGPSEGVFATMAIGEAGAKNAALFVVAGLATTDQTVRRKLAAFRSEQTEKVLAEPAPVIGN